MSVQTAGAAVLPAELISVRVGGQLFALDIMVVREIRGWSASTPLPRAPAFVLGMINLRGAVLPVLDLALRLGLPASRPDASSVVVVAELGGRAVGLLVSAVCDIITVAPDRVQPAPDLGEHGANELVQGVITLDAEIVTLLDLRAALPETELAA